MARGGGNRAGLLLDHFPQIAPRHEFHDHAGRVVGGDEVIDADDVRIVELRLNVGFALQAHAEVLDLARAEFFGAESF